MEYIPSAENEELAFTMAQEANRLAKLLRPAVIAIDGPAASGKSTIGNALAETLEYLFFDTGIMYRAVTLIAIERNVDLSSDRLLGDLAESIQIDVLPPREGGDAGPANTIVVDGRDVTSLVRQRQVDRHVSTVSASGRVRTALSNRQRAIGVRYGRGQAERCGIVMVGRDIGTVVMPNAPVKLFMDAPTTVRARRRYRELASVGKDISFDAVEKDIIERDRRDSERALSPLRAAEDAIMLDTTNLSLAEVLDCVLAIVIDVARQRTETSGNVD